MHIMTYELVVGGSAKRTSSKLPGTGYMRKLEFSDSHVLRVTRRTCQLIESTLERRDGCGESQDKLDPQGELRCMT